MCDLSSPTGDETHALCIERWSCKHCTTREVPRDAFLNAVKSIAGPWFSSTSYRWQSFGWKVLAGAQRPGTQDTPCRYGAAHHGHDGGTGDQSWERLRASHVIDLLSDREKHSQSPRMVKVNSSFETSVRLIKIQCRTGELINTCSASLSWSMALFSPRYPLRLLLHHAGVVRGGWRMLALPDGKV